MIEEQEGIILNIDEINFDDKNVYDMLKGGDVSGIFQLANQSKIVQEVSPKSFSDLIAINAIIRPGCTQLNEFIEYSKGKKWSDYDERLPYTSDTYGLIVYQEQFLLDCKTYASWDIAFADNNTRKNKGIKNDIELYNKFISDGIINGYDKNKLEEIWQGIINACMSYNFNKSHATSYGVLSYKTAWLKCHYPIYWYASLMNSEKDKEHGQQRVEGLIAECKKKGIQILPPDINKGSYKFEGTRDGIRIPINLLKGVGEDVVKYIQKELVPITSFEDMLDRGLTKYIKKNVVSAMVKSGVFDFENTNREHFIWVYNMRKRKKTDIKNGVECEHLEYDEKIKLKWEREVLGMYLSRHPLGIYNARSIEDYTNDMVAIQVVEITDVREHMQKNGKMMCFIQGSNQHGSLKCLIFADSWASQDIKDKAFVGNIVMLKGKRSGSDMIIQDIENMEV